MNHTGIPNEVLEALAGIRIPGEARQCLDVIIRKTYGLHKKEDSISLSQFATITQLGKTHICRNLNKLTAMKLIITQKGNAITQLGNEQTSSYRINEDLTSWLPLPKKVIITQLGKNHYPIGEIQKKVSREEKRREEKIRLPVAPQKKKEPDLRLELKCRVFLTAYNFYFYSHFDTPATLLSGMAFWEQTLPLEKMIQGMMFMEKSWFGGTRTPTPEQMFQRHNRNNEPVNHFEAALNDGRTHLDWEADHRKIMTHLKSTKEYQDYERTLQLGAGLPVQAGVVNHPDRPTNQEADARLETVSGETTGSTGNRSVVQTGDS